MFRNGLGVFLPAVECDRWCIENTTFNRNIKDGVAPRPTRANAFFGRTELSLLHEEMLFLAVAESAFLHVIA